MSRHIERMDDVLWPQSPWSRPPEMLAEVCNAEGAMFLMLTGLMRYFLVSVTTGRTEDWRKVAHSMIDLLADENQIPYVGEKRWMKP